MPSKRPLRRSIVCVLLTALSSATHVHATDYFIRTTGSNANAGTSAATAWKTVRYALENTSPGDKIYVGAGTYDQHVKPLSGAFGTIGNPIEMIADTDGSQTGDAGDVILTTTSGTNVPLLLEGDVSNHDYLTFRGLKITTSASPGSLVVAEQCVGLVFENCEIYGNTLATGRALQSITSNITIRNCSFYNNRRSGLRLSDASTVVIEDSLIYANNTQGSGDSAGIELTSTSADGTLTARRCQIYNNSNAGIISEATTSTVTLENCLISGNSTEGVDYNSSGTLTMRNCTVVDNLNDGVLLNSGTADITNCIIADNTGDGLNDNSTMTHTYNLVYGNTGANFTGTSQDATEIVKDPQFVSSTDYRVLTVSPAVNTGTDLSGTIDDDLEGRVRPHDLFYDMGCYEEGPTAHWKLDETSGTTAVDSSGFGNDATYQNNPSLGQEGVYGNAVNFNLSDTDDYIDLPNTVLDGSMDASVSIWIKNTTNAGITTLLSGAGVLGGTNRLLLDFYPTSTAIRLSIDAESVSGTVPAIDDTTWHHFVWTWDGDTNTVTMYRDGQLVTSGVLGGTTGVPLSFDPGGLIIGQEQDCIGGCFDSTQALKGRLDDLRIYNRVLTSTEVADLYGLIGHWKLDETSGTTAADSSEFGNDGTVTGTATWKKAIKSNGLDLDYTDGEDYVEIPNSPSTENVQEGSYTLSAWFKLGSIPPGTGSANDAFYGILMKGGLNMGIYSSGNGRFWMVHYLTGTVWSGAQTGANFAAPGQYYHVAGVVDREAGTNKLYVNGILQSTATFTAGTAAYEQGTQPWRIGIANSSAGSYGWAADATVDDARIYNRALNDTDIAKLYGLMGHWELDETSGTLAADSSPNANDGTYVSAPTLGECAPWDTGVEFDGTADYVSIPKTETLATADLSIAAWVYFDGSIPSGSRTILEHHRGGLNWYGLWKGSSNNNFFFRWDKQNATGTATFLKPPLPNTWYHVVGTFDASAGEARMYLNGELVRTVTGGTAPTARNGFSHIGRNEIAGEFMDGTLDDVRVYNRVIGQEEIADLMGLKAHWKLDETSGTTATDASCKGNDGTYTGGVLLNQPGNIDQAAEFDGSDDYVGVPDDPTLQMDDVFSLSGWIRPNTSSNVQQMILNKEGEYEIAIFPNGELILGIANTDPGWEWHTTGHIIPFGKWAHIAMTYGNGTISTYANGVLVDTYNGSGTVGDLNPSLNELRIGGRSSNPPGKYFNGRIDDVRVFKRVLCPEEIFGQYKGGRPAGIRILKWVEVR